MVMNTGMRSPATGDTVRGANSPDGFATPAHPVLLLTRRDIAALMKPEDYLAPVEEAFRCLADGRADLPLPMHIASASGGFHVKGCGVQLDRALVAVKLNANFPDNTQCGLPAIQGVVLLCEGEHGSVLAVMDSIEITSRRTAAASALAARHLARSDASVVAICGCGTQGRAHLEVLAETMAPARVLVWDVDQERAQRFATHACRDLGLDVSAVRDVADATRPADVIVTVTSARTPFLTRDGVSPGAFIAAVGADNPDKGEIAPQLMARAKVVVDVLAQCISMGDLHRAIDAGAMTCEDVHAALGDIVTGRKPGRASAGEVIVFDSTGAAALDATCAAEIHRRAAERGIGTSIAFGMR